MDSVNWLPPLICMSDFGGDWDQYVDVLYSVFLRDFVCGSTLFRGSRVGVKRHPEYKGRGVTFWHLISEGKQEGNRLPDLRRCERIAWPKPIIEHEVEKCIKVWENQRHGETRICLWFQNVQYLVVLAKRRDYALLWTAYCVTQKHRIKKLEKEYQEYRKSKGKAEVA